MVVAASRPMLALIGRGIRSIAQRAPVSSNLAHVWLSLAIVPLVGSLITEPAAMTLAALLLAPMVFHQGVSERIKYFTLGVLFVNISIGGTLSAFAAPPVLMVAQTWQWDNAFMVMNFGWKASIAVLLNATAATYFLRSHLVKMHGEEEENVPLSVSAIHLLFLAAIVYFAHHPVIFIAFFLFFLGFTQAYPRHQSPLILKEGLLVGFFLAGLVVLGGMQQWWLQPIVSGLAPIALFFGSIGLTAVIDNAALTYLGSLVQGISDEAKYMLVAGAVAGGGLTVIANAPNPAGIALLRGGFKHGIIGVGGLLAGALLPTLVASALFLL
jgi:Putative Na+/H+ antiporter